MRDHGALCVVVEQASVQHKYHCESSEAQLPRFQNDISIVHALEERHLRFVELELNFLTVFVGNEVQVIDAPTPITEVGF